VQFWVGEYVGHGGTSDGIQLLVLQPCLDLSTLCHPVALRLKAIHKIIMPIACFIYSNFIIDGPNPPSGLVKSIRICLSMFRYLLVFYSRVNAETVS